jgi:uncharacterized lipoprotein YmbA
MKTRSTLALLLLAGCSFFSRTKNNIYSLERIAPATRAAAATRGLPVGIDTLELPPGFDRREIVVRKADHQLDVRPTEQWAAALQPSVLHTLSVDLADRLPEGLVILPGQAKPAGAMRNVDVVFEELAAGPENAVTLDARWVLRESGRPAVSHHERLTVDLPALDSANVAAGFSRALAALADRMAGQLGGA